MRLLRLSGVAALVYQTAWTRQFAIVFGTSELAVATVLAAYMGGLALGAGSRNDSCRASPARCSPTHCSSSASPASAIFVGAALLWLANLALAVACSAGSPRRRTATTRATTLFYLISAFVALALPTTLMGATLPLLARYAVAEEAQIGRRIGLLYAMNTAGAVVGALLTAFVLLPELGLTHTIWFAAALNGLVFLLAVALGAARVARRRAPQGYETSTRPGRPRLPAPAPARARLRLQQVSRARPGCCR